MANKAKSVNKTSITTLLIVQSPVYPLFFTEYLPPSHAALDCVCLGFADGSARIAENLERWAKLGLKSRYLRARIIYLMFIALKMHRVYAGEEYDIVS